MLDNFQFASYIYNIKVHNTIEYIIGIPRSRGLLTGSAKQQLNVKVELAIFVEHKPFQLELWLKLMFPQFTIN